MKFNRLVLMMSLAGSALVATETKAKDHSQYAYATVLTSEPIVQVFHTSRPERNCWQTQHLVSNHHEHSATGTIFGTLVGAAIGNAVGHNKTNKRVGAVAGALLGGSIGSDISRENRGRDTHSEWVTQCETTDVVSDEERVVGYRVTYVYNGETYITRLSRNPGNSLKLRVSLTPVVD